jgi:hypothetical protein
MKTHRPITTGLALLFFLALIVGSGGGSTAAASATTFSGQASVISGQVAGIPVNLVDTGPVDAGGGHLHAALLEYPGDLPDATSGALTAEVLHATVVAHGNKSSAEAVVANFSLAAAGQNISAEFLAARASATCNSGAATISGSSEIAGLTINGQTVTVGTQPQTITLPLGVGSIFINEQPVASASGDNGAVTVNALHIVLLGGTDLVVASAHADITCATTQAGNCANKDFVTGGGWITTQSGSRATFAVAGGPDGWGHFEYIDHGSGLKVKGTGVTFYGPGMTGPTSRQINGTAQWTGGGGTYSVEVADNGEPGHYTDLFWLKAPMTENANLGGGNIQLHCK